MVQSFDYNSINKPNYNAVKINIKKPEVNASNDKTSYIDNNGIYNAVDIEIDNPTVNTEPKKIYDYPYSEDIMTYDMFSINTIPVKYPINYHTTNIILPKMENELEVELDAKQPENIETENNTNITSQENVETPEIKNEYIEIEQTINEEN